MNQRIQVATTLQAPPPNVFQRAMALKTALGIEQATTRPMLLAPQRIHTERSDWWMYPAEMDYSQWVNHEIPIRAVHWPIVTTMAPQFDRLFIAHELPHGAEFTESMALAPATFVRLAVKPFRVGNVSLAPFAPMDTMPLTEYGRRPPPPPQVAYDPILFGVITDGRTGVFMPIAQWTWRV
jgi:hypothetical protein